MATNSFRFTPIKNGTTLATIGTSSSEVIMPALAGNTVRIVNAGTATVFVDFDIVNTGTASVSSSMPVLAGSSEFVCIPNAPVVYAQGISGSAAQNVYFTRGDLA